MTKPVKHTITETKALLDKRLHELHATPQRVTWEEIKKNARQGRIEKGIEDAEKGNLIPWKKVKAKIIKRIKLSGK